MWNKILMSVVIIALALSGCGAVSTESEKTVKDQEKMDTVGDEESGSEKEQQDSSFVSDYKTEDLQKTEPYMAELLVAIFDFGSGSCDPKNMSVDEQCHVLEGYLGQKISNGDIAGEEVATSDGIVSRVSLSKTEAEQILYSLTGQEYGDDLGEIVTLENDHYVFEIAETRPEDSLKTPIIKKLSDRISVTAVLCAATTFEISELCDVAFELVPDENSEFGAYVDNVTFDSSGYNQPIVVDESDIPEVVPRSEEELCQRALEHYEEIYGEDEDFGASIKAYDLENEMADIIITYHVMDHYEVMEEYMINPYTGLGSGMYEEYVDLR